MKVQLRFFSKKQRSAILSLIGIIVLLQILIVFVKKSENTDLATLIVDEKKQKEIDSLKLLALKKYEMQPFNPNFIDDRKAAKLGMSPEEVDRLKQFRASGSYVNSAKEFQNVTKVSDELLKKIAVHFKFPEWTRKNQSIKKEEKVVVKKLNLNTVTHDELLALKGIGDYFARQVLNERTQLGGFISVEQLDFIKGLRPEAAQILKQSTYIQNKLQISKVNLNTATKEEIAQIPYINSFIAREIVVLRSKKDQPLKIEDLERISSFPLDKLKIIRLYLDF
ncbi:MAG TPA: helix-hairpin-helix domain-containing protein [Flavobacterium sp.]|nr:helix-hairpin-helix domain-containing protein [Flavobacterium sp.]